MPLYRFIKLMLVVPVDFFSGRKLYVCITACLYVFYFFDVSFDMDYRSPR